MCEILIQVAPRTGDDIYKTAALPQPGDVIVIMEDGHPWGVQEMTAPDWRIFALPGVDASAFANLLTPEVSTTPGTVSRTLQYRAFHLDTVKLAANSTVQAVLQSRTAPIIRVPVATLRPLLTAAIAQRPPVPDPAVIGSNPAVIG